MSLDLTEIRVFIDFPSLAGETIDHAHFLADFGDY
jgi:hypothetical protein